MDVFYFLDYLLNAVFVVPSVSCKFFLFFLLFSFIFYISMSKIGVNKVICWFHLCRMYGTVKYVTANPAVDLVCVFCCALENC